MWWGPSAGVCHSPALPSGGLSPACEVSAGGPVRFLTDNELCKPLVERLGFSDHYELCLCVGFGYADEQPEAKPRNAEKVKYVE